MRILFFAVFLAFNFSSKAQQTKPTTSFIVSGKVKSIVTINGTDLARLKTHEIGNVTITNHLGEKKSEAKTLKGVLLKDVLAAVEFDGSNPRLLSEFYLICKANDGYTVVYSWNEIFNNPLGDKIYIVTEKEGVAHQKMDDAILMISPTDLRTGRRHLKALQSIEVKRAGEN
ncbi:MAG: hypothetical protein K2U26_01340 [Cyclobacteriaceae bacterium]|nr:hypothetical protein [Cyclobacteriaceae bacterium]